MQYEALRRAQEMQQSANRQRNSHNNPRHPDATHPTRDESSGKNSNNQSQSSSKDHAHNKSRNDKNSNPIIKPPSMSSPIDTLFEDKEKLLILLLVLILSSEENSDPTMLLALLYLII